MCLSVLCGIAGILENMLIWRTFLTWEIVQSGFWTPQVVKAHVEPLQLVTLIFLTAFGVNNLSGNLIYCLSPTAGCAIYSEIQRSYVVRFLSPSTSTFKNPKYLSSCNGLLVCLSLHSGHKSNQLCWKGMQTSLTWRVTFHTKQRRRGVEVYPIWKLFCFCIPMPFISRNTCSHHKFHLSKATFSSFLFFFLFLI